MTLAEWLKRHNAKLHSQMKSKGITVSLYVIGDKRFYVEEYHPNKGWEVFTALSNRSAPVTLSDAGRRIGVA